MRIGTWNLAGYWSTEHVRALQDADCDVWLLTEVPARATAGRYQQHLSPGLHGPSAHWSGILTRLAATSYAAGPETVTAASIADLLLIAAVLPGPEPHADEPWAGDSHAERYGAALGELATLIEGRIPIIGGNLNQPLMGNIIGYSRQAQAALGEFLSRADLQVPTRDLLGRQRQYSVDHIVLPASWEIVDSGKFEVPESLSPYDAFCVEAVPPRPSGA